jgi:hypothetical protein
MQGILGYEQTPAWHVQAPHGVPSGRPAWWQPAVGSQPSVVHGGPASQLRGSVPMRAAPRQRSIVVQTSRSVRGSPSGRGACRACPGCGSPDTHRRRLARTHRRGRRPGASRRRGLLATPGHREGPGRSRAGRRRRNARIPTFRPAVGKKCARDGSEYRSTIVAGRRRCVPAVSGVRARRTMTSAGQARRSRENGGSRYASMSVPGDPTHDRGSSATNDGDDSRVRARVHGCTLPPRLALRPLASAPIGSGPQFRP